MNGVQQIIRRDCPLESLASTFLPFQIDRHLRAAVKSGDVRDLVGTIQREEAAIGVFLTLEPATKPMIDEAASAGYFHFEGWHRDYPRMQILTVEEVLAGKQIEMPPSTGPFKQAEKMSAENADQNTLGFE